MIENQIKTTKLDLTQSHHSIFKLESQAPFKDRHALLERLKNDVELLNHTSYPKHWIEQQLKKPLHPSQLKNLEALKSGSATLVITGQQPCLLGGPSLTLHKILHTLAICDWLKSEHITAVPVFWSASEDHDLDEMLRVELWGNDLNPKMIKLSGLARNKAAECFPEPKALHQDLKSQLSPWLQDAFFSKPSTRFVGPFHHALQFLFSEHGLIVIEPRDLTATAEPFWNQVEHNAVALQRAYEKAEAQLMANGLTVQAPRRRGLPIFALEQTSGLRTALNFNGSQFFRDTEKNASTTFKPLLQTNERLSPGALLRPIFAQSQLPILISVLGPAEHLYHQQTPLAFKTMHQPMPLLWPRLGGTYVPEALQDHFKLSLADLDHYALTQLCPWLPQKIEPAAMQSLALQLKQLEQTYTEEMPIGTGPIARFKRDLQQAFNRLQRGIKKADLQQRGWPRQRTELLERLLYPKGAPQERRLGWAQFLNSAHILKQLKTTFSDPFDFSHRIYR